MTDNTNPLSRALRATETLGLTYPGLSTQEAVTAMLEDIMHLQDAYPDTLHLEGALDDARNSHDTIAAPEHKTADVVDLEAERFRRAHEPSTAELEAEEAEAARLGKLHPSVTLIKDGTQWLAHGPDFVNLVVSEAAYGPTPAEAMAAYQQRFGETSETEAN